MYRRKLVWGLCALSWACGDLSSPQQETNITQKGQVQTYPLVEWDADLGQNRVWLNENEYYLERKAGDTLNQFVEDGKTFVYVRQGMFTVTPTQASGRRTVYMEGRPENETLAEQLLGSRHVDEEGRVWRLHQIDPVVVQQRVNSYSQLVKTTFGEELPCSTTGTSSAVLADVFPGSFIDVIPSPGLSISVLLGRLGISGSPRTEPRYCPPALITLK